jgi:hypothetical protein
MSNWSWEVRQAASREGFRACELHIAPIPAGSHLPRGAETTGRIARAIVLSFLGSTMTKGEKT